MTHAAGLVLSPAILGDLLVLCQDASPDELWALVPPTGDILILETESRADRRHRLTDQALLKLGLAESKRTDAGPWFLLHSHPQGRAVLSAQDRLAMTSGNQPAWPFPMLVLGLYPEPTLAHYEWNDEVAGFVVRTRYRLRDKDWLRDRSPLRGRYRLRDSPP